MEEANNCISFQLYDKFKLSITKKDRNEISNNPYFELMDYSFLNKILAISLSNKVYFFFNSNIQQLFNEQTNNNLLSENKKKIDLSKLLFITLDSNVLLIKFSNLGTYFGVLTLENLEIYDVLSIFELKKMKPINAIQKIPIIDNFFWSFNDLKLLLQDKKNKEWKLFNKFSGEIQKTYKGKIAKFSVFKKDLIFLIEENKLKIVNSEILLELCLIDIPFDENVIEDFVEIDEISMLFLIKFDNLKAFILCKNMDYLQKSFGYYAIYEFEENELIYTETIYKSGEFEKLKSKLKNITNEKNLNNNYPIYLCKKLKLEKSLFFITNLENSICSIIENQNFTTKILKIEKLNLDNKDKIKIIGISLIKFLSDENNKKEESIFIVLTSEGYLFKFNLEGKRNNSIDFNNNKPLIKNHNIINDNKMNQHIVFIKNLKEKIEILDLNTQILKTKINIEKNQKIFQSLWINYNNSIFKIKKYSNNLREQNELSNSLFHNEKMLKWQLILDEDDNIILLQNQINHWLNTIEKLEFLRKISPEFNARKIIKSDVQCIENEQNLISTFLNKQQNIIYDLFDKFKIFLLKIQKIDKVMGYIYLDENSDNEEDSPKRKEVNVNNSEINLLKLFSFEKQKNYMKKTINHANYIKTKKIKQIKNNFLSKQFIFKFEDEDQEKEEEKKEL